ncbi:MAG: hypothetical protein HY682_10030 [Chloroflexi bacterium]|nr:hypothetical protein [Chloroflexota bacterium]
MRVNASFHPVRRSALEALHARAGAHWRSDTLRWPLHYGDAAQERAAIRETAGLIDLGPSEKLSVRQSDLVSVLGKAGLDFKPGQITQNLMGRTRVEVWGIAPDEALLVSLQAIGLSDYLDSKEILNVSVSSALYLLRVVGPRARRVLTELCPLDLGENALGPDRLAHTAVANVPVTLGRQDFDGLPGFTILVPRDYAAYLWGGLLGNGRAHGLQPTGTLALERG